MAKLKGIIQMTGRIGDISIYKRKGCSELIVRTRGGISKERLENDEKLVNVRRMNTEWSGVAQMAGAIRHSLIHLSPLSDYNYLGQLNAKAKAMQKLDTTGEYGQRAVLLSQNRQLLNGFSLNKDSFFSSIVRTRIDWTIDRKQKLATVHIDSMQPDISLNKAAQYPFYRFTLEAGIVSDIAYDREKKLYKPVNEDNHKKCTTYTTGWLDSQMVMPEQNLMLSLNNSGSPLYTSDTLLLGIGIEFGFARASGGVEVSKNNGCARILGLG